MGKMHTTELSPRELAAIRRRLLRWYGGARRDLPWRRTADPYRIWLSEIMLQQTRVEVVIPYYRNFLREFPTVSALARASEERVLAAWSGLGYYSRARNLQRAARVIVEQHAGKFPREEPAALALPGVGRYTAAAVLSIAYGAPLAVLDGNVARVLSRLLALAADVRDAKGKARLWERAAQLLDARRPGDFNQAMMELGATVCVPAAPRCAECPLEKYCRAHQRRAERKFPPARPQEKATAIGLIAAVVRDAAGRVLLQQRAADAGWMAGFWELPTWEAAGPHEHRAPAASRAASVSGWRNASHRSALRERLQLGGLLGSVPHSITRFRIVVEVREAALIENDRKLGESAGLRWATLAELRELPVSTITRKALRVKPVEARGSR